MKLSVNILTYNCMPYLKECVEAVQADTKAFSCEIIVVDNGSTDGSDRYLREIKGIETIIFEKNEGISKGKNAGIKRSYGDYFLLLDADIVPVKGSIPLLIKTIEARPHIDALGFKPNKWALERQRAEQICESLSEPELIHRACLYYGIFRYSVFSKVRLDENDAFGSAGYGWEDIDFYLQMKENNIQQWVCDINCKSNGLYFHAVNSSIRAMGHQEYIKSSVKREKYFRSKWGDKWKDIINGQNNT